jgi:quinol monooxygenase YgiN
MGRVYTSCEWIVRAGSEDDFVTAWTALGAWAKEESLGSSWAVLLRDRDDLHRFVSFGPWESDSALDACSTHPTFVSKLAAIGGLLERFRPQTLDEVAAH